VFFELDGSPGKGFLGTKIAHRSLQAFRIPTALHFCRFAKGSNLRAAPTDVHAQIVGLNAETKKGSALSRRGNFARQKLSLFRRPELGRSGIPAWQLST
jgi:hypothetical protein